MISHPKFCRKRKRESERERRSESESERLRVSEKVICQERLFPAFPSDGNRNKGEAIMRE